MTFAAIQEEIKSWSPEEQDELATYLTVLRQQRSREHVVELGQRLQDRAPENWMTLDEVKAKLSQKRSAKV